MTTYSIVRFHINKPNEIRQTGLSLMEAQEHCNDSETQGNDWFDGYVEE